MIRKIFLSLMVVSVFLVSSCSQSGVVRLGPEAVSREAVCPVKDVLVFASEVDLPEGFVRLAVVNYRGWQANTKVILSWLKLKAQQEGGNAIVLKSIKPKGLYTYSYGTGEALVVLLK